jgi:hypothetical protein
MTNRISLRHSIGLRNRREILRFAQDDRLEDTLDSGQENCTAVHGYESHAVVGNLTSVDFLQHLFCSGAAARCSFSILSGKMVFMRAS